MLNQSFTEKPLLKPYFIYTPSCSQCSDKIVFKGMRIYFNHYENAKIFKITKKTQISPQLKYIKFIFLNASYVSVQNIADLIGSFSCTQNAFLFSG